MGHFRWGVARTMALMAGVSLAAALAPVPASAQAEFLQGFDAYVEEARQDWQVPGVAVAVVKDGRVVYARGFGQRDADVGGAVDEHTVFAIGSSTKPFTAAAVGMLVADGRVSWDDPVVEHMPGFRLPDPYRTAEITFRDLLAHRTGVGQAGLVWTGTGFSRDEILRRLRHHDEGTSLRSAFGYSNEMYLLAGEAVGRVAGTTWDDFVRDRLLEPLGMTRSGTSIDDLAGMENVASPHVLGPDGPVPVAYRHIDNIGPAGSINASVLDLAQWVRLNLGEGTVDGREILPAEVVREMQAPQMVVPGWMFEQTTPEAEFLLYGLGWFLHEYRGHKVVEHGGAIDGMHALVGMLPGENLGIAVVSNRYPQHLPYALMYRVFDAYLGEPSTDWSTRLRAEHTGAPPAAAGGEGEGPTAGSDPETAGAAGHEPTLPLDRYAGTYDHPVYGPVEITLEAEGLVLRRPASEADLAHRRFDTFVADWRSPGIASVLGRTPVLFTIGPAGQVVALGLGGFAEFQRVP
ncbi:MAG TPA: serine hydrolase [Longimicrobiales bacterium]|nr:serine hydrolase [Longimicrobiales bacterium]